jgi:hypothetical protein
MKNILFALCFVLGGFLSRCDRPVGEFEFPEEILELSHNMTKPDTLTAFINNGIVHFRFKHAEPLTPKEKWR